MATRPTSGVKDRSRGLVALVGAVAAHAAAGWFAFTREPPESPTKPAAIELRVIEREPRPGPVPVAPPPPRHAPKRKPAPPTPETAPAASAPSAPANTGDADAVTPPAGGAPTGSESTGTGGPAPAPEGAGIPAGSGGNRDLSKVDLFAPGALSKSIHLFGDGDTFNDAPGETAMGEETPEQERARVAGRIERDLGRAIAHGRVEDGLADPYFTRLAEDTKSAWNLTPSILGLRDEKDAASQWANFAASQAAVQKAYARTGSPFGDAQGDPDPYTLARPVDRNDGFQPGRDQMDLCIAWNNGDLEFVKATVVLQLIQEPNGEPVSTKVLDAQASAAFIASAREAIIAAAKERLAPQHGFGLGGRRIKSEWRLTAKVFATNPSCVEFDESLGIAPHVPKTPETKVKYIVELIALYDGETAPVDGTRAN